MATNNAVNVGLSGSTGSGNFVGSTSAVLVTPTLGAATATSVSFSPTTGGIIGTTTNDNAGAGKVGEFISSSVVSGSATSISNNTATNLTSISLTAGDWDVFGNITFIGGSNNLTTGVAWISSTSATLPDSSLYGGIDTGFTITNVSVNAPMLRFSLSGTTTIYISGFVKFGAGSCVQCGNIFARRVR